MGSTQCAGIGALHPSISPNIQTAIDGESQLRMADGSEWLADG